MVMNTVTLNVKVDEYSNRVLEVVKAVYGLPNKSEAFNKIVHELGAKMIEPELREDFARQALAETEAWEKKYGFKRSMSLKELDGL